MIEADRVDHSRAKLDHDLIVPITTDEAGTSTRGYHIAFEGSDAFFREGSMRLRTC